MAGKRNYEWPLATEWDAAAFLTQDKSGGVTQRVSPALVETKLEADGFPKIPSPSANEVAVYGVGGWDSVKLVDANIDAAAAIGWSKISKSGAVASDVGALPEIVVTGAANFNSINGGLPCAALVDGSSYTNAPIPSGQIVSTGGCSLIQLAGEAGSITQLVETMANGSYFRSYVGGSWSAWKAMWDSATLPAGTTGKALLATATQADARSAISALPTANPTATGTLTAPDVVVSNLAGTGTRPAALDSTGKLAVGVFTAKDCLNVYTTAPTAAPNYIRANSYTAAIATSASYRGSLKGIVDGSTVSVKFTIGGVTVAGGDQLDFVNGCPFVLEWWLETYAPTADAFLNFRMTVGSYSSDRMYSSLNQFPAPVLGSADDLKIEFKIGNTSVTVRTMSEIVERIG